MGDTMYDIQAGKKAKCKTIAFLAGTQSKKKLQTAKPDVIIKSLKEILALIKPIYSKE